MALPSDAPLILQWENMPEFWGISEDTGPFKLADIEMTLQNSYDLIACGQLRWIMYTHNDIPLGVIDLFNYDARRKQAGIGILIGAHQHRGQGYGQEAVHLLIDYCRAKQHLRGINCLIHDDNIASIRLFTKCGFSAKRKQYFKGKPAIYYELPLG